ncbi:MAG: gliding motility-associated C-terminal domain-containing protein [Paludibacteraceae bacterium]|nr:gliding motility-associated C-terminal domain-containing protein [Paludibacteraceae bacterium]
MNRLIATLVFLLAGWTCLWADDLPVGEPELGEERIVLYDTVCYGSSYVFGDRNIDTAGVYLDTVIAHSKMTMTELHLEVAYGYNGVVRRTIETGESYLFGSKLLTMGGTYVDTLVSEAGCDSVVTLFLKVNHPTEDCGNLVTLFLEDFGGNQPSDPIAKGSGIPQCNYNYNDNPKGSGNYAIRKVGWNHNQWYYPFFDHTYPGDGSRGYMLQADGSSRPGAFYQTRIDGLCEGSLVYVYFWGCSATATNFGDNANLSLVVLNDDGEELARKDVTLYNRRGRWEEFGMYVRVPANTSSINYKVTNNSGSAGGNDFFLDDVGVAICIPPTQLEQPASVCRGSKYQFNGKFVNDGVFQEPLSYRWLYSKTGDLNTEWQTIAETATPRYEIAEVTDAHAGYYRLAVGAEGDADKPNCKSISAPVLIVVDDCLGPHIRTSDDEYNVLACRSPFSFNILDNDDISVDGYEVSLLNESKVGGNSAVIEGGKLVYSVGAFANATDVLTYVVRAGKLADTSTVTINVSTRADTTINAIICEGESLQVGGLDYSSAGTYAVNLTTVGGCDSVVTLNLTVNPKVFQPLAASICQGQTYAFAGLQLDSSGTYADTALSLLGCDSITHLSLTVLPVVYQTVYDTVCLERVALADSVFSQVFTSHYGCDSIFTRHVHYHPKTVTTEHLTICEGSALNWNGMVLTATGRYEANLTSSVGCDSTVVLDLEVAEKQRTAIPKSICTGETFRFGNLDLSISGNYADTLIGANGCDSIVTLHLNVIERKDTTIAYAMCKGESYQLGTKVVTSSGVYAESFTSSLGCDSVVTLNVTVNEPAVVVLNDSVCEGADYEFAGNVQTYPSGSVTLQQHLNTQAGCDSFVTVQLVVLPTSTTVLNDTAMLGENYARNDFLLGELTTLGNHTQTLNTNNSVGCDSMVTLNLVVLPMVDNRAIPTAFSPSNADGSNDVFMKGYEVYVYDRYGNLICHSTNGWDGRYHGSFADAGVYVYFVVMKDGKKRKGTIEVLKD